MKRTEEWAKAAALQVASEANQYFASVRADHTRPVVAKSHHEGGRFLWQAATRQPGHRVTLESTRGLLLGDFRLRLLWQYLSNPVDPSVGVLRQSTIALEGRPPPSSRGDRCWPDGDMCLIRYDVEQFGAQRGKHLHVHQPPSLSSKVHSLSVRVR